MVSILFVWTGATRYAADCWRALAQTPGVTLRVVVDVGVPVADQVACPAEEMFAGLDCACVTRFEDAANLGGFRPDVLFAVGWHSSVVCAAVIAARYRDVPKVCCFDMPWRFKPRCLVAPLVLGPFLRRYAAAFVPGASAARYARWLGFRTVRKGFCAVDAERFSAGTGVGTPPHPYFLYLGRDAAEKRVGDVRAAHALYRAAGGSLGLRLHGKGLEDGPVAPKDVPDLLRGAAAIVLASSFDPWPVVLLEAMSVGCPVVASDRCTNRPDLGKNWRTFPCGDVKALAAAMADVARAAGTPQENARRTEDRAIAAKYGCDRWVREVLTLARDLSGCDVLKERSGESSP